MTWKRSVAAACLAAGLSARLVGAQEPTPTPAPTPTPEPTPAAGAAAAAPPIEAKPKEAFFGNRFALYLEVRAGSSSADDLFTDIQMTQNLETQTTTTYEDIKHGEFTIGWTLPRDRGQYLFTYTGVADGGYSLDATGLQRAFIDSSGATGTQSLESLQPWWHTSIRDGQLRSRQTPAVWDQVEDDADGDGFPDASEIRFPTTAVDVSRSVPDDLGAHLSTYDLYYRREFGGTRYHARWTAGGRYFDFGAALPMPLWINVGAGAPGVGYTEGIVNPLLVTQHKASGWGPVGSGEVQFNFFRRRLQLYGLVRAAYIVQKSEVDSGIFEFLARDVAPGGGTVPRQGHFATDTTKSTWNSTFEAGVRFRILPGFHVFADWNKSGYLDPIIVPTEISFPTNSQQVDQPVGVSYKTEDVVLSTIQVGLSFQF